MDSPTSGAELATESDNEEVGEELGPVLESAVGSDGCFASDIEIEPGPSDISQPLERQLPLDADMSEEEEQLGPVPDAHMHRSGWDLTGVTTGLVILHFASCKAAAVENAGNNGQVRAQAQAGAGGWLCPSPSLAWPEKVRALAGDGEVAGADSPAPHSCLVPLVLGGWWGGNGIQEERVTERGLGPQHPAMALRSSGQQEKGAGPTEPRTPTLGVRLGESQSTLAKDTCLSDSLPTSLYVSLSVYVCISHKAAARPSQQALFGAIPFISSLWPGGCTCVGRPSLSEQPRTPHMPLLRFGQATEESLCHGWLLFLSQPGFQKIKNKRNSQEEGRQSLSVPAFMPHLRIRQPLLPAASGWSFWEGHGKVITGALVQEQSGLVPTFTPRLCSKQPLPVTAQGGREELRERTGNSPLFSVSSLSCTRPHTQAEYPPRPGSWWQQRQLLLPPCHTEEPEPSLHSAVGIADGTELPTKDRAGTQNHKKQPVMSNEEKRARERYETMMEGENEREERETDDRSWRERMRERGKRGKQMREKEEKKERGKRKNERERKRNERKRGEKEREKWENDGGRERERK
ncbi:DEAD-box ATP-dependent RNA helicase 42, partial [Ophiophagus hannah]